MLGDIRYAFRTLGSSPGFTIAAVLTLALGIGANTAIFTAVYGVLLKPLPYERPDRLIRITEGRPGFRLNVSYPNFLDWRERNRVFDDMALYSTFASAVIATTDGPSEVFPAGNAVARLFSVLGVSPARGRVFTAAEEEPGAPAVAVISDALWQRRFGGDGSVVGTAVRIGSAPVTIIGVMPSGSTFQNVDVWFPMRLRQYVFGISPIDPLSMAAACGVLIVAAVCAAWVPARRAAGIDPLTALRNA